MIHNINIHQPQHQDVIPRKFPWHKNLPEHVVQGRLRRFGLWLGFSTWTSTWPSKCSVDSPGVTKTSTLRIYEIFKCGYKLNTNIQYNITITSFESIEILKMIEMWV